MKNTDALNFLCYISILVIVAAFIGKVHRDTEIIENLTKLVYDKQIELDNLEYQFKQCKLLYIGQ